MRLDKFRIGSTKSSPTHAYKNLKDVYIDFDEKQWVTVVIGWNGTGKSNVLEAISIIFRELISPTRASRPQIDFAFELSYEIGKDSRARKIFLQHDPDRAEPWKIEMQQLAHPSASGEINKREPLRVSEFLRDENNLPRFVFSYYSGESNRLKNIYLPYLTRYDKQLRSGDDPGLKRLFFALPEHSQFVLLAFLIVDSSAVKKFLAEQLNLDPETGLDSVMFVLRQPPWMSKEGDSRFWNAKGVVQGFLDRLMKISLCPVGFKRTEVVSQWGNRKQLEFKYHLIRDLAALRKLVGEQTPAEFFRDLESTHVSQLIDEIRINVRVKKNEEPITFVELSEGERQLLTVLGLMRFTAGEESLFLLDEPDTHLNPRWSVDYLRYIEHFISEADGDSGSYSSHVVLTTHNPMAIAELQREQVQILVSRGSERDRQVVSVFPEESPKGMGYASIITSDMFGIASTLDRDTQALLEKQRELGSKDRLTDEEQKDLARVNRELGRLGFRFDHPDDEYMRYLKLRSELLHERFEALKTEDVVKGVSRLSREEREQIARKVVADVLDESGDDE
ncbi:chromosome segregation protein SMC [Methylobacterium terricola]|uniref:Chromosome segregation protein SMC n=1 Tax=Methylobacterium terricola TaxID=2583531 RepID=A0A5C4L984_9HYPH|nr:AAA family ATPase [Methylobacterium terricola]TNC09087.1 chromosome segregation protein SMC [Methylobacterium terricola]